MKQWFDTRVININDKMLGSAKWNEHWAITKYERKILDVHFVHMCTQMKSYSKETFQICRVQRYSVLVSSSSSIIFCFVRWTFSFCVVSSTRSHNKWTIPYIVSVYVTHCHHVKCAVAYSTQHKLLAHLPGLWTERGSVLRDFDKKNGKWTEQKYEYSHTDFNIWSKAIRMEMSHIILLSEWKYQNWLEQMEKIDRFLTRLVFSVFVFKFLFLLWFKVFKKQSY